MWSALASSVGTLLEYAPNPTQSPPLKYGKTFLQKKLFRGGTSGGGGGGEGVGRGINLFGENHGNLFYMWGLMIALCKGRGKFEKCVFQ